MEGNPPSTYLKRYYRKEIKLDSKEYMLAMVKYYLTIVIFNLTMIICLCLTAYLFKSWAFLIVFSIVINVLRAYIDEAYHCDKLWQCIILTNFMFLVGSMILMSGMITQIASLLIFIVSLVTLFAFNDKTILRVVLVLLGILYIISPQYISDCIMLCTFFVVVF